MPDLPVPAALFVLGVTTGILLCAPLPSLLRTLGLARTNFRREEILTGGGLLFALSAVPWLFLSRSGAEQAAALAAVGFGLLGFVDDRWGTAEHKGLRGHLRALRSGQVTTGLLKAAGGAALALLLAWRVRPGAEALLGAAVIALCANLLNLLDLRPLRALKFFWLAGLPLAAFTAALLAQLLGLSLPYARLEARRQVMLGDTGSNCLGGVLGVCAVLTLPVWGLAFLLAALLAFHAWAEKHSLSAWIDARPWARRLDRLGWGSAAEGPPL
jgi:UDP-N-acetylmuramyl pentapeptide phosphotransferase/UDP-N-acetylglucosamine-1-phosphate transferase